MGARNRSAHAAARSACRLSYLVGGAAIVMGAPKFGWGLADGDRSLVGRKGFSRKGIERYRTCTVWEIAYAHKEENLSNTVSKDDRCSGFELHDMHSSKF